MSYALCLMYHVLYTNYVSSLSKFLGCNLLILVQYLCLLKSKFICNKLLDQSIGKCYLIPMSCYVTYVSSLFTFYSILKKYYIVERNETMSIKDELYIGTNYHPHDWSHTQWIKDLDLMRDSNFNFVRLGHLCWDSFEETENNFTFEWMDNILDLCHERNIRVFMDIPTRPAPSWLHKKYPYIDIVTVDGVRLNPNTRYMEDVGDPHFQFYAFRLAEKLVAHFHSHPALVAFGLCNELGSGYHSYSETARIRFTQWLKAKYNTIELLNNAWSAKRWSRKVLSFDDIEFPVSSYAKGAPERFLDMKRFFSDEILKYLEGLHDIVKGIAPELPVLSNHWAENQTVGFDYHKNYLSVMDYPGQGFYPGTNPEIEDGFLGACFCSDYRCGEMNRPIWDLEFQTGGFGDFSCPPNAMRMYSYLSYAYRAQTICAWTFRSMLGGEEQYLFGLVNHDGTPSFKLQEFAQIAMESKKLNELGLFPRKTNPSIAIAYSYESLLISNYADDYYTTPYIKQVMEIYKTLFHQNLECNIIDLRQVICSYKVVIIPGHAIIDEKCEVSIRSLLEQGATVIMTAFSAKVNENNQVFSSPLPGKLDDVFGIRIKGFDRTRTHIPHVNAGNLEKEEQDITRKSVYLKINETQVDLDINYHELMELTSAIPLASYSNSDNTYSTAISCNTYANGKAIYVGIPATEDLFKTVLPDIMLEQGIYTVPDIPNGVIYRMLDNNTKLYINSTPYKQHIALKDPMYSILHDTTFSNELTLDSYDVEILRH